MHVSLSEVFNLLRLDTEQETGWMTQDAKKSQVKRRISQNQQPSDGWRLVCKMRKRICLFSFCLLRPRMEFSMTLVPSYLAKYLEINKIFEDSASHTSLCLLAFKLPPRPQRTMATEIRVLAAITNKRWYGSQSPYPTMYTCLFYILSLSI